MKRYSQKGREKRIEERKDFPEFFQKHIQIIKDGRLCCEECGERLKGDVSEIAHVLPKSKFKSISTNDLNVIYLCGMYSNNNCHSCFDNWPQEKIKEMNIFPKVCELFKKLEQQITENINYKVYDKYTN